MAAWNASSPACRRRTDGRTRSPLSGTVTAAGSADYGFVAIAGQICIVDRQTLVIVAVLPSV